MAEEKERAAKTNPSKNSKSGRLSVVSSLPDSFINSLSRGLHLIEVCLAGISLIFVVVGIAFLLGELLHFWTLLGDEGLHTAFENVLSDILLLVVGVELAIMLIRRTPESLIEVMFFVIARKTLIKTDHFYELLVGVVALAGLFAIRKYLQRIPERTSMSE